MHIMHDIETLSTEINAVIVSIGAVQFNKTGIMSTFYEVIAFQKDRHISANSVLWWLTQSDKIRKVFEAPNSPIKEVLEQYSWWIKQSGEIEGVWGNGSDFDNAILSNAFKQYKVPQPWDFRQNRCYRTIKSCYPEIELIRTGDHHNALDDAKSQAEHLIRISHKINCL